MARFPASDQLRLVLIDGYVDEPSCLGVPPYISPHVRYAYGALVDLGVPEERISYATIDQYRSSRQQYLDECRRSHAVIIIAGATVPGRYLGGHPISLREIRQLAEDVAPVPVVLGGPIVLYSREFPVEYVCGEIAAQSLHEIFGAAAGTLSVDGAALVERLMHWAVLGATVTGKHPYFPYVVCELETYRGCPRKHNCAFCSEGLKQVHYHRPVDDVLAEVAALAEAGNRYFRIGCQTDLLLYGAKCGADGLLYPQPAVIERLYRGIHEVAPRLGVLHMDNANPASIMRDPAAAAQIIATISRYNTAGDTAALGLESADPVVLRVNSVETSPEETMEAIRLLNKYGGWRHEGIPKLLPGLNFLHGLQGERPDTFQLNLEYLRRILDEGLLVRRVNIRQVLPVGGYKPGRVHPGRFQEYKERVNEEVNRPMLRRVFPRGTLLRGVRVEEVRGRTSFGRQLGTYPILVGLPGEYQAGRILDVRVIDHGYRSVTALPSPFRINRATVAQLEAIPGLGRRRALKVFMAQPVSGPEELRQLLEGQVDLDDLLPWFDFS